MYYNVDSRRAHDPGIDTGLLLARPIVVLACALSVLVRVESEWAKTHFPGGP
jgi:hypothetical protein